MRVRTLTLIAILSFAAVTESQAAGRPGGRPRKPRKSVAATPVTTSIVRPSRVLFRGFGVNSMGSVAKAWPADQNTAVNRPFATMEVANNSVMTLPEGNWHLMVTDGGGHAQADLKLKLSAGKSMRVKAPQHNEPASAEEEPETTEAPAGDSTDEAVDGPNVGPSEE
ncbi:MAG: hypothetical protein HY303_16640 [Candidatus Wallbacteria bacterium]|nr:hypothetical protein [Candidatus Wallbacteria bacterium]